MILYTVFAWDFRSVVAVQNDSDRKATVVKKHVKIISKV